ncbi:hypothetical protein WJX72_012278 [[Myrmecia] bisecta]|uniref:Branched-chain-amino-acid aminotransferase n=1 Tax=[Myrmecia] bisecta TaxID=41462 RepID=A0AAW1PGS1_9CHLO
MAQQLQAGSLLQPPTQRLLQQPSQKALPSSLQRLCGGGTQALASTSQRLLALPARRRRLQTSATIAAERPSKVAKPELDWESLGFGLNHVAPTMFEATFEPEHGWQPGSLRPYGPMQLLPSAQVLNYGQSIFEGMKAQRSAKGRVVLFRPDMNAKRMQAGAQRMSMPTVPEDVFVEAVKQTLRANLDYVPPQGKGSLYMRPMLMGTGPILGLGPAPSYTFLVYAAAVGAYFKGGQLTPIDLIVEEHFHRSAPGGMGGTKAAGNYSPVLVTQLAAKTQGYADVVYLDAKTDTYLEEVSSCNIFTVKGKTIKTPPLQGTILPGVTRRSVLDLAQRRGYTVEEVPVSITEAMEADEVFTSGTAVVVCSVGSMTYKGQRKQYNEAGKPGPVALEIYEALTSLQQEKAEDPFGWVVPVA